MGFLWERTEEGEKYRHTGKARRHGEDIGGTRWKRVNAMWQMSININEFI